MTKKEILDLIQHRKDTNTFYAQCAGYGFHGTDEEKIAAQLNAIICQIPGCCLPRCEQSGRLSYLCPLHYKEAYREETDLATVKTTGLLLAEPDWNAAVFNSEGAEENAS